MRYIILLLFTVTSFAQIVDNGIYTVEYSEEYEQPLWVEYSVKCPNGKASRQGMDFWVPKDIKTSDNEDYRNNI